MQKLSDFIIGKRTICLSIILLITLFFAYRTAQLEVCTVFADLLPQGHEYIKLHNKIRAKFGGANSVNILLQGKKGDLYDTTTLQKIKDITDELYLIPAVDRFKIMSLAVNYMLDMVVTSGGFDLRPMMWPHLPQTEDEMAALKERVYASSYYGSFVWFDNKRTLITADFFEDDIDYTAVFKSRTGLGALSQSRRGLPTAQPWPCSRLLPAH